MTSVQSVDGSAWAIPPEALPEWLRLAAAIDAIGAVPCRTSDPEAWWPNRNAVDHPPARMAREACFGCDAKAACLDYALAADESEGIWGGLTVQERETLPKGVHTVDPLPRHEHRAYSAGCPQCQRRHAHRVAEWRARKLYAGTTKAS